MPAEGDPIRCCIAGGGPAGMMLATLLARAGVDVLVLEKHADFLRDFRGDTIHPSTLEIMHELGWLDEFLQLPHQKVTELRALVGSLPVTVADFRHLPTRCRFIAFMPQWDFLNFLTLRAARYPGFRLWMRAEATDLVEESGRVVGMRVTTADGPREVRADLVVAADGRQSVLREKAGLAIEELERRWMCCGSGCRAGPMIPRRPWDSSGRGASSSCSTAATTGSAATSSPRGRWSPFVRVGSTSSASRSPSPPLG